jgi:hypothetical protein
MQSVEVEPLKTTILYRPGESWGIDEIENICDGLNSPVIHLLSKCPEYIVIFGHYTNRRIRKFCKREFNSTRAIGKEELPFRLEK